MPQLAKISVILLSCALMVLAFSKPARGYNPYVDRFNKIYANGGWNYEGSGLGSVPANAAQYIQLLQQFFSDPKYKTIVDLGCGDWQIMQLISIPQDKHYYGYDVSDIILATVAKFAKPNVQFFHTKSIYEFAKDGVAGDLLIVKDVLQHMPSAHVSYFIEHILPKYKYALITNDFDYRKGTTTVAWHNTDIKIGGYRPLRLQEPPFNLKNVVVLLEYNTSDHKQVLLYTNSNN